MTPVSRSQPTDVGAPQPHPKAIRWIAAVRQADATTRSPQWPR